MPSAVGSSDPYLHWWYSEQSWGLTATIPVLSFTRFLYPFQSLECLTMIDMFQYAHWAHDSFSAVFHHKSFDLFFSCFWRLLFPSLLADDWQTQQEQWNVVADLDLSLRPTKMCPPVFQKYFALPVASPSTPPVTLVGEMLSINIWIIDFNDHFIVGSVTEEYIMMTAWCWIDLLSL